MLDEHLLYSGNSRAQSYCKHFSWEIPEPIHTVYELLLWSYGHVTHSFETRKHCTTPVIVLEPHGPSMYTLYMGYSKGSVFSREQHLQILNFLSRSVPALGNNFLS